MTGAAEALDIQVRGLSKSYGDVQAVADLDLHLKGGVFAAVLGPSGSGKTTLLNILAGLVAPTNGNILVGDRDVAHLTPQERNIGLVFQNYALFPHMTVYENIAFPLRARRMKDRKEVRAKIHAALDAVQLAGYENRLPAELSGGQQQRVAIARALVFGPDLLLLDEPLGALDKQLREHMQVELRRLHRSIGVTTVFVTHDQEEAMAMADAVIIMRDGRIEQVGTPRDVYERPANLFVAGFVGNLNQLPGRVQTRAKGGPTVCTDNGVVFQVREVLGDGEDVVLGIRPEGIQIVPARGAAQNTTTGVVVSIRFLGSYQSLVVRIAGSDTEVTVRTDVGSEMHIDQEVGLLLPREALVAFAP